MTYLLYYWLILALIFLIFEMINPGLFLFLSVSMGSVGAFVSGLFNVPLQQQLSIFFASFVITFIVLTVWLRQFQKHSIPKSPKRSITIASAC